MVRLLLLVSVVARLDLDRIDGEVDDVPAHPAHLRGAGEGAWYE
jgi:hypothetical protein